MSHSDYLESRTSSRPQRPITGAESASELSVSCWTPGKATVDISASDRQILEIHAERLVEEVFTSEIEPILQEPAFSPTARSHYRAPYTPPRSPEGMLRLPPAMDAGSEQDGFHSYLLPSFEDEIEALGDSTRLLPASQDAAAVQLEQLQKQGWQDRVLLGAGLAALGVAMMSGFATQSRWQPLAFLRPATVVPTPALSNRDPFLDYLRASLHRLQQVDAKSAKNFAQPGEPSAVLAPTLASAAQPLPLSIPGVPPGTQPSATLPQNRVAVKPTATAPAAPAIAPLSATTALPEIPIATLPPPPPIQEAPVPSTPNFNPPPPPQVTAQAAPAPLNPANSRGANVAPASVARNSVPTNSSVIPLASSTPIVSAIKNSASRATSVPRTLVGVLEMEEQSLALIEVNGTTRRVRIGEVIGGDDSVLLRVGNQEAVVQRGQEQLSVQVGQQF